MGHEPRIWPLRWPGKFLVAKGFIMVSRPKPSGDQLRHVTVPQQAFTQLLTIAKPRRTPPVSRDALG
jgi:hypothetical protein